MKLVFVTQTLDPEHPVLGQTLDLIDALASRVEELRLVARTAPWGDVPSNASVDVFDAPRRVQRVAAFEKVFVPSVRGADGVLVHMVPEFAILAAPAARVSRVPLLLWYTHWHASRSIRVATRLVDAVLSVDRASFPLTSAKVHGIGHAIDVRQFDGTPPEPHDGPLRLLALGRTARWKGLATLIEAFRSADLDATLEVRGPSLTPDERAHRRELEEAAAPDPRVSIEPSVPRAEIPALLRAVDVVVSPAEPRAGATLDKAVYEAAACSRPVVTTNAALASFLRDLPLSLIAPPRDPAALARSLDAVVRADAGERAAVGAELRRRVVRDHSVEHWAERVVQVVSEVRSRRGG